MTLLHRAALLALAILPMGQGRAADIALYPSGPAEDSAFIRFVNAGADTVQVRASGSQAGLALTAAKPASDFFSVAAKKPIKGTLLRAGQQAPVDVTVKPGEFATVVGLPGSKGLAATVIKESPDDFNAMRASIALYNADAACAQAGLRTAGRNVEIFSGVAQGGAKRRLINPTALTVELTCGGQPQGAPVELGSLAAGQRYTVIAVPADKGARALFVTDNVAH